MRVCVPHSRVPSRTAQGAWGAAGGPLILLTTTTTTAAHHSTAFTPLQGACVRELLEGLEKLPPLADEEAAKATEVEGRNA